MKNFFKKASLFLALFAVSPIFAEAAAEQAAPRQQNYTQTIVMLVVAAVFFYFILLRPEQKRRKKLEDQRKAIKKGARVTAMGIVGTVDRILDKTIVLQMIDGAKVEILKQAVTEVEFSETETKPQQEKPTSP